MENCDKAEGNNQDDRVMDVDGSWRSAKLIDVLRSFLGVQQRRAEAYSKLRRYREVLTQFCFIRL